MWSHARGLGAPHNIQRTKSLLACAGDLTNSFAISLSLFEIVMVSVVLGSGLPFILCKVMMKGCCAKCA